MPDTKISAATAASALDGTEVVPGVQGTSDVKISADQLKTHTLDGLADNNVTKPVTTQTASYVPTLADANSWIRLNSASAVTLTLPQDTDVEYPIGTELTIEIVGAGGGSFVAGTGATVNSRGGDLSLAGQYSVATAKKVAANTWTVTGDL